MDFGIQDVPFHILMADDDMDDRMFFEKALAAIPVKTILTAVQDGDQLMNFLLKNRDRLPDVLFLDLSMPGKTGFECLAEIKEDERISALPVVVLTTSFGRGQEYEQSLKGTLSAIGAVDYIPKPSSVDELQEVIHRTIISISGKRTMQQTK